MIHSEARGEQACLDRARARIHEMEILQDANPDDDALITRKSTSSRASGRGSLRSSARASTRPAARGVHVRQQPPSPQLMLPSVSGAPSGADKQKFKHTLKAYGPVGLDSAFPTVPSVKAPPSPTNKSAAKSESPDTRATRKDPSPTIRLKLPPLTSQPGQPGQAADEAFTQVWSESLRKIPSSWKELCAARELAITHMLESARAVEVAPNVSERTELAAALGAVRLTTLELVEHLLYWQSAREAETTRMKVHLAHFTGVQVSPDDTPADLVFSPLAVQAIRNGSSLDAVLSLRSSERGIDYLLRMLTDCRRLPLLTFSDPFALGVFTKQQLTQPQSPQRERGEGKAARPPHSEAQSASTGTSPTVLRPPPPSTGVNRVNSTPGLGTPRRTPRDHPEGGHGEPSVCIFEATVTNEPQAVSRMRSATKELHALMRSSPVLCTRVPLHGQPHQPDISPP